VDVFDRPVAPELVGGVQPAGRSEPGDAEKERQHHPGAERVVAEMALRPAADGQARVGPGRARRSHEPGEARSARTDESPDDAHDDECKRRVADLDVPRTQLRDRRQPAEHDRDRERPMDDANERIPDTNGHDRGVEAAG
jgi:hypothetical protein